MDEQKLKSDFPPKKRHKQRQLSILDFVRSKNASPLTKEEKPGTSTQRFDELNSIELNFSPERCNSRNPFRVSKAASNQIDSECSNNSSFERNHINKTSANECNSCSLFVKDHQNNFSNDTESLIPSQISSSEKQVKTLYKPKSNYSIESSSSDSSLNVELIDSSSSSTIFSLSPDCDQEMEQISELMNKAPHCLLPLPKLKPHSQHHIMFRIPLERNQVPRPYPSLMSQQEYDPADFVKMPYSRFNEILSVQVINDESETKRELKWDLIQNVFKMPIKNFDDLKSSIRTYNPSFHNFGALYLLLKSLSEEEAEQFFGHILPELITLTLQLPSMVTRAIPLLKQGMNSTIFLSQHQISCLLANAFFSTFPKIERNSLGGQMYPTINFTRYH